MFLRYSHAFVYKNAISGDLDELRTEKNRPDFLLRTKEEVQRNSAY